ncbi:alpha/beta hydrolase [Xinfangfangia sp. D13-10-4-6]|uniref:alpha/beta fold hydrolase n=1 Tax=Pseudogemmobacter hezensis TaxID=2737662 RepID=UPI00155522CC|nr:alpha/beta hydrolase [Pseudogemmobacter hezensis]NPD13808.1 alpha/beta hydrolase [Pseudogemmobacter hezensis]
MPHSDSPRHFFTATDGARLAYALDGPGNGLPVLCLAGLTRNRDDFLPALPGLSGCRVIRMDYRGRGDSDFTGPDSYTVAQEAADALALLDHLGIEKAAILGTSRGGLIALLLAATAKERLLGICLNDIGPEIDLGGLGKIAARIGKAPQARTLAEMAGLMAANSPGFTGLSLTDWQEMAGRLFTQHPDGLRLRYDPRLRDSFLAAFDPAQPLPDLWPLWHGCDGLALALIRGANSDLLREDTARKMREIQPGLIFAEVPGRGHVPLLNEPQSITALTAWIGEMQ